MPSTRQGLMDYCLRKLGHPVIEINIDEDQLEDRINEAIEFYREFHYDASEAVYLAKKFTSSQLTLTGNAASFINGEAITGSTSAAYTQVHSGNTSTVVNVWKTNGSFQVGETVTGARSGATSTVVSFSAGSADNQYFSLPDEVHGVTRILPLSNKTSGVNMFDIRYQLFLNDIQSLLNLDIIYYSQIKTQINLINDLLTGQKPIRFNRHTNRLYVDLGWTTDLNIGDHIIIEGFKFLNPNEFTDVYNDTFLKDYATALIKQQWGTNLKKFEGVQLPGGVTLNGQKIYDEATEEIKALREEIRRTWELPVDMFVG